jgi:NAD(P)H dehydrogenase (quinone)
VTTFLELIGQPDDRAKLKHFEAVTIDQQEGLLAGVDDAARSIAGQLLVTVEEFIDDNRALFELHYPTAVA